MVQYLTFILPQSLLLIRSDQREREMSPAVVSRFVAQVPTLLTSLCLYWYHGIDIPDCKISNISVQCTYTTYRDCGELGREWLLTKTSAFFSKYLSFLLFNRPAWRHPRACSRPHPRCSCPGTSGSPRRTVLRACTAPGSGPWTEQNTKTVLTEHW